MSKLDMNAITKRIFASQFTKLDNVVWSITDGGLAIVGADENLVNLVSRADGTYGLSQNSFNMFGLPIPAFATRATLAQLNVTDLLVVGAQKDLYWVVGKSEQCVKVLSTSGIVTDLIPTNVSLMGSTGDGGTYMRVQNLTTALGGSNDALGGLQGMLLPMMLSGGDVGSTMEKLLPMMLLTGGAGLGGASGQNPLMMMMLMQNMGDKSGFKLPF